MSLTKDDIVTIRDVVFDAIGTLVLPRFDEHDKRFEGLEKDVKVLKDDVRVLKQDMSEVRVSVQSLEGKVAALEADIKELYHMVRENSSQKSPNAFTKLSLEKKILKLNTELLETAQQAGITLPR